MSTPVHPALTLGGLVGPGAVLVTEDMRWNVRRLVEELLLGETFDTFRQAVQDDLDLHRRLVEAGEEDDEAERLSRERINDLARDIVDELVAIAGLDDYRHRPEEAAT